MCPNVPQVLPNIPLIPVRGVSESRSEEKPHRRLLRDRKQRGRHIWKGWENSDTLRGGTGSVPVAIMVRTGNDAMTGRKWLCRHLWEDRKLCLAILRRAWHGRDAILVRSGVTPKIPPRSPKFFLGTPKSPQNLPQTHLGPPNLPQYSPNPFQ